LEWLRTTTYTTCLFLDIRSAFDNVLPNILIQDLIDLGIPPKICYFIHNLISHRKIQFIYNGESSELLVSRRDVPQEYILSPILFNLYVAKLKDFISNKCEILQFADIVIFNRSDLKKSLKIIETSANQLSYYLYSRDLEDSPQKSSLVICTRKSKYTFPTYINLDRITGCFPITISLDTFVHTMTQSTFQLP